MPSNHQKTQSSTLLATASIGPPRLSVLTLKMLATREKGMTTYCTQTQTHHTPPNPTHQILTTAHSNTTPPQLTYSLFGPWLPISQSCISCTRYAPKSMGSGGGIWRGRGRVRLRCLTSCSTRFGFRFNPGAEREGVSEGTKCSVGSESEVDALSTLVFVSVVTSTFAPDSFSSERDTTRESRSEVSIETDSTPEFPVPAPSSMIAGDCNMSV